MAPVPQLLAALAILISATTGTAIARDYAHISRNRESFPVAQHVLQRTPTKTTSYIIGYMTRPTFSEGGIPEGCTSFEIIPENWTPCPETPTPVPVEPTDPFMIELKAKMAEEEKVLMYNFEWEMDFLERDYKETRSGFIQLALQEFGAASVNELSAQEREMLADTLNYTERNYRNEKGELRNEHADRLKRFDDRTMVMRDRYSRRCGWKNERCQDRYHGRFIATARIPMATPRILALDE